MKLIKRPNKSSSKILFLFVITLTSVIQTCHTTESLSKTETTGAQPLEASKEAAASGVQVSQESHAEAKSIVSSADAGPAKVEEPAKAAPAPIDAQSSQQDEAGKRKGRAESSATSAVAEQQLGGESSGKTSGQSEAKSAEQGGKTTLPDKAKELAAKSSSASAAAASTAAASAAASTKAKQAQASKSKSKLPANLGTVTSTGSGGPMHYMSKHDAYSAIAEKHGALAQDAMRKSDKHRISPSGFGGIQKASGGLGDMLSPFKQVTDSDLARTLGASMRSIMKSKYSVPAYVASALLGAVALMAFYESPISPLPVPPLPEPPIGRFPPELPNISPNVQVPFRGVNQYANQFQQQQQNYNQRSLNVPGQFPAGQGQQQQVLFPSSGNQAMIQQQQRQVGPVQQLAANLIGQKQNAQRKSGPDYEQSSSRSFFSGVANQQQAAAKMGPGGAVNKPKQGSSFLSYFGFGGASAPAGASDQAGVQQASSFAQQASASLGQSLFNPVGQAIEPKGGSTQNQASSFLSNSHLFNKVKSLFTRPASGSTSSAMVNGGSNLFDQYQKMSFVQAFMKDAAFLPGFLSPTRKSSTSSSPANKIQSLLAQNSAASPVSPTSTTGGQQPPAARNDNLSLTGASKSGGYGVVKSAGDRFASALLETLSSSIGRSVGQAGARKGTEHDSGSSLTAATSLLSDIMSSYGSTSALPAASGTGENQSNGSQEQSGAKSSPVATQNQVVAPKAEESQPQARSEESAIITADEHQSQQQQQQQSHSKTPESNSKSADSGKVESLSRKTRSVGFEYPIESQQELTHREQGQQISRAAQINNIVDFVADSYTQNRMLFNFVMNQVGLSQAVPYVEQFLASGNEKY